MKISATVGNIVYNVAVGPFHSDVITADGYGKMCSFCWCYDAGMIVEAAEISFGVLSTCMNVISESLLLAWEFLQWESTVYLGVIMGSNIPVHVTAL